MTTQTASTKVKLEVAWTESEPFEVTCKHLPPQEPRVLQKITIMIRPEIDPAPESLAS